MDYIWAISVYQPNTDKGKAVLAHLSTGTGYILQNKSRLKQDPIIVAYKFPADKQLSETAKKATPEQAERLEEISGRRK